MLDNNLVHSEWLGATPGAETEGQKAESGVGGARTAPPSPAKRAATSSPWPLPTSASHG